MSGCDKVFKNQGKFAHLKILPHNPELSWLKNCSKN
jgi:hypothetical protein